ncbi:ROK family transcriptional regulator [Streptomyces sp. NBC_00347]|uniref:ROK family transcriptional regulator n=1 Tax=Streptomyces sp. NBC_00347 TaxID=2975721 RepID=UPI002251943F|nr:ROK family protein [Streptomyces sp. NBC_00347]MCX5126724.1 ROK family protein [Streptomyces sp. NBC_00347]
MTIAPTATGPHVLRRINTTAVLDALRSTDGMTARVSALVATTGLSRPAVSRALTALADIGVLEFLVTEDSGVGRPAQRARFRAEHGHVAGIDIGPHKLLVTLADLSGTVCAERRVALAPGVVGREAAELLRTTLADVAADAGVEPTSLWAVTVGTPGVVDVERGEVVLAPSIPGWAGLPVLAELRDWLGCPVLLDNDVNLAVTAERWRGPAEDNLLYVHWGERIGSGIIIDGKPHRGASSAAGELGFVDLTTPLDDEPEPVVDGLGPFERLVGAGAILELATERCTGPLREALRSSGDVAILFEAAANGDEQALTVVRTVARRFARGLATHLLAFDPECVVVGGGVSGAGDVLFDAVRTELARMLLTPIELRTSALRERGVVLGAIRMSLDTAEQRLADML